MLLDTRCFESHFGFPPPPSLVELYSTDKFTDSLPAAFRFNHVEFVIEIQQLLDVNTPNSDDAQHKRLPFAVTTDGQILIADLSTENLNILHCGCESIDSIGITIKNLKEAEIYSL